MLFVSNAQNKYFSYPLKQGLRQKGKVLISVLGVF